MIANDEMLTGYRDGFDLDAPEPSANRSNSYRHGFKVGRADRSHTKAFPTLAEASRQAEMAMALDGMDGGAVVVACQGPPTCHLQGDDAEAAQEAGCARCKRIVIDPFDHQAFHSRQDSADLRPAIRMRRNEN